MRHLYSILLSLLPLVTVGQNLVPNPSFEEYVDCPNGSGQVEQMAEPWYNAYGGCDYFHECGTSSWGVPNNRYGYELARTGDAYSQITCYTPLFNHGREHIGVELIEPLEAGIVYRLEFFVSCMDSMPFAIRNMGAYFSTTPLAENIDSIYGVTPQVQYSGTDFLNEKVGWTRIHGSFMAEGGELYLSIGNFDTDENTDTLFLDDGGSYAIQPEGYWEVAAYYLDDVSVTPDSIFQNVNEKDFQFSIYPNPATDNLRIESQTPLAQVKLNDLAGRTSIHETLRSAQRNKAIDISSLPSGIYLLEAITKDGRRSVQKVVVQ